MAVLHLKHQHLKSLCLQNQKQFQYWQSTTVWTCTRDNFLQSHQYGTISWADINALYVRCMRNINEFCVHPSSLTCVSLYIFKYFSPQNIPTEAILSSCIYNNEGLVWKGTIKFWATPWARIMFIHSKGFGFAM